MQLNKRKNVIHKVVIKTSDRWAFARYDVINSNFVHSYQIITQLTIIPHWQMYVFSSILSESHIATIESIKLFVLLQVLSSLSRNVHTYWWCYLYNISCHYLQNKCDRDFIVMRMGSFNLCCPSNLLKIHNAKCNYKRMWNQPQSTVKEDLHSV